MSLFFYIRWFFVSFSFFLSASFACTTVSLPQSEENIVAKTYDWSQGHGLVVLNKKDVEKSSLVLKPGEKGTKWKSQYASIIFTQQGREFALGGMNTQGLVVEIMWLNASKYPSTEGRETVNQLQWIQYQLDNYKTVAEMVQNKDKVVVSLVGNAPVHYLACDATGACASFEYLKVGKENEEKKAQLVVRYGKQMRIKETPIHTLTNDPYDPSKEHLKGYTGFGGNRAIPSGNSSLERFVRASDWALRFNPKTHKPIDYAFDILESVGGIEKSTNPSQFQIVYETKSLRIHFQTREMEKRKTIDLKALKDQYACNPETYQKDGDTVMLDVNANIKGNVNKDFIPYTTKANEKIIREGLKVAEGIPPSVIPVLAKYPHAQKCKPPRN